MFVVEEKHNFSDRYDTKILLEIMRKKTFTIHTIPTQLNQSLLHAIVSGHAVWRTLPGSTHHFLKIYTHTPCALVKTNIYIDLTIECLF